MNEKGKIRPFGMSDKIGYAFGDFGNDFTFILSSMFMLKFYTDIMGISAGVVGGLMMAARFVDAFTDVTMGQIVDRSKPTKDGKFKPWIKRMCGPVAIASFLIYQSGFAGMPYGFKVVWMTVTYLLWGSIFYTSINIPYGSMASAVSPEPKDRAELSVWRTIGATLASLVIGVGTPLLAYEVVDGKTILSGSKMTMIAGIFAVCAVICYLLCFKLVKERVPVEANHEKLDVVLLLKNLFTNRALMGIILAAILLLLAQLGMSSFVYFENKSLVKSENICYNVTKRRFTRNQSKGAFAHRGDGEMEKKQTAEEFCRDLWRKYLVDRRYDLLGSFISDRMSCIGTGAHEVCRNMEEFVASMMRESKEWDGSFLIKDEWYQTTELTERYSLVIGELVVREDAEDGILYDMRFRFTVVLEAGEDGFRVLHIHQSVPDANQSVGEFFPHIILEKNAQEIIYRLRHDGLTGLLNRSYLQETVNRFLEEGRPGMMLMMDIDLFKQLNDGFGHPFGDKVLENFAQSLQSVFAEHAIGRIGGDEFVVYLDGVEDSRESDRLISRFRADWKERQCLLKLPDEITVSIGAACSPKDGNTYGELWKRADKALYQAKGAGRGKGSTIYAV